MAQFHSSYMPAVLDVAKRYRVDPRILIIELCRHDKVNAPKDLLEQIATTLDSDHFSSGPLPWSNYYGEEQSLK